MKTHTLRTLFATLVAMLCALFALPQRAQAQEAYVQLSADKTTLTFYYDKERTSRSGTTWGIEEKNKDGDPIWAGFLEAPNKEVNKAVLDASFRDFRPTSTSAWFYALEELKTILGLENLNTSEVTDMSFMFTGCKKMDKLILNHFNTSKVKNMMAMFANCHALTDVQISSFNTEQATDISAMFAGCKALTSLDLSNFNTPKVQAMQQMFTGCSALTSLTLSSFFTTSNVRYMKGMFEGCSALKKLDLSNFNTEKVEDMSAMFADCQALTSLNLFTFNTAKVWTMIRMFAGCSALKELDLSSFNTSKVIHMSAMFSGCSALTAIYCANTWQSKQSKDMFKGCTALKGAVAYDASKLDVTMANPETGYFTKEKVKKTEAYVQMSADQKTLTFFYDKLRDTRQGQTWGIEEKKDDGFPAWAFLIKEDPECNTTTTKAVFDASFKNFHPISTFGWLSGYKALTTFEGLENLNTEKVTDMRVMFANCSSLKNLNLKNFNTAAVTNMRLLFYECSSLTELNLSSFNTTAVKEMGGMFYGCSSLTALDLKNFNTAAVEEMGSMFAGCSDLKVLNLSSFNTAAVKEMSRMFYGCSSLTALDLSNFNTAAVKDMGRMFAGCSDLNVLDLSSFNIEKMEHMVAMFQNCSSLKTIYCPNTWQCKDAENMFQGCTKLQGAVKFDANKLDVTMANPTTGYFTKEKVKKTEAYVHQSADKKTLTFYYDNKRATRSGTTWGIEEKNDDDFPAWAFYIEDEDSEANTVTTKTVFDASFQDFLPTTTLGWFSGYKALTTLEGLEHLNTEKVTDMESMFSYCSALTDLDLKNFNTTAVTKMGLMFANCSSLTSLDLSNFNTEKMKSMSWMFANCSALKTIYCPNTWQCKSSQKMFAGCTKLQGAVKYDASKTDVTMANPNNGYFTIKLEAYVHMSADKTTLTFFYDTKRASREGTTWGIEEKRNDVTDVPAWASTKTSPNNTTTKVVIDKSFDGFYPTSTAYWFMYFKQLTTIEGLQHLNTSEVTNMEGTFAHCSSLTALDLKSFNTKQVTNMSFMFGACSSLTALDLSTFNTEKVNDMNSMFANSSALQTINLSTFNTEKVTDMSAMFSGCSALKELDLKNFNTEKVENMRAMFAYCPALTDAQISSFNTEQVTDMGYMFIDCKALTSLNLSNFNTAQVKDMSGMFWGCSGLATLDIQNFNTSNVTKMKQMFYHCSSLKELDLSNFNTSNVTNMTWMFRNCSALTAIHCPNTWQCQKSEDMFAGCTQLKGAVKYDASKVDVTMANPTTGYFTKTKPTAIEQMFLNAHKAKGIYTLQGKRVTGDFQHLPAGVYIVNGKKVEVRRI
jgi:hypothetical protein